ncbi:MAG: methyltransferase domain-containing protein [Thermoplasmatota archaeon]
MNAVGTAEAAAYASFYQTAQGDAIAEAEAALLDSLLPCCSSVLSVGCGPAIVEHHLAMQRPDLAITGMDTSAAMLQHAPDNMPTIQANAEALPFANETFDAVLYITSLEFIAGIEQALDEARRVLRPAGRLISLMLSPASPYFRERYHRSDSYVHRHIRHVTHDGITAALARRLTILQDGYRLGVAGDNVVESTDPETATLHVLEAVKYG